MPFAPLEAFDKPPNAHVPRRLTVDEHRAGTRDAWAEVTLRDVTVKVALGNHADACTQELVEHRVVDGERRLHEGSAVLPGSHIEGVGKYLPDRIPRQ